MFHSAHAWRSLIVGGASSPSLTPRHSRVQRKPALQDIIVDSTAASSSAWDERHRCYNKTAGYKANAEASSH